MTQEEILDDLLEKWKAGFHARSIEDDKEEMARLMKQFLFTAPISSPIDEDTLARDIDDLDRLLGQDNVWVRVKQHLLFLTRALFDCEEDGTAAIWSAGYKAGQKSTQRKEMKTCPSCFGFGETQLRDVEWVHCKTCEGGGTVSQ